MRYRDRRRVLLKGVDVADVPACEEPATLATPRWISARASGYIAAQMAGVDVPEPIPNRRDRRSAGRPRRRWRALPHPRPWDYR